MMNAPVEIYTTKSDQSAALETYHTKSNLHLSKSNQMPRDSEATLEYTPDIPLDAQKLIDSWVSLRLDLVLEMFEKSRSSAIAQAFWTLISTGMKSYPTTEFFSRHHLRCLIYETFIFAGKEGIRFSAPQHTDLVIFMASLSSEMAIQILNSVDKSDWTEQAYAIAYHLDWLSASSTVIQAESDLSVAFTLLQDSSVFTQEENLCLDLVDAIPKPNPLKRQKSLWLECALPITDNLQEKLKQKHWIGIRVKFENCWRGHVASKCERIRDVEGPLKQDAVHLLNAIIHLAIHFEEYEYAWYFAERACLSTEWPVLLGLIKACRCGADQLWKARGWALYKSVLDHSDIKDHGDEYTQFMIEFSCYIQETEPVEACLQILPRLITDMLEHCSSDFFPLTDSVINPLLEVCWKFRNESKTLWENPFRKIFEVYVLHKFYKSRRSSALTQAPYFTPSRFVTLLSLCTTAGFLEEFKILNRDVLMAPGEDQQSEYVSLVQKGYTVFISNRAGHDIEPEVAATPFLVSKLKFDRETLERLKAHLLVHFPTVSSASLI